MKILKIKTFEDIVGLLCEVDPDSGVRYCTLRTKDGKEYWPDDVKELEHINTVGIVQPRATLEQVRLLELRSWYAVQTVGGSFWRNSSHVGTPLKRGEEVSPKLVRRNTTDSKHVLSVS